MGSSEKITFKGSPGVDLAGWLDRPSRTPSACALLAHCVADSSHAAAATRLSRALAERGIAVLRFELSGIDDSGGEFANTDPSTDAQDLVAATRYLREHVGAPEILVGHGLGGAAALVAAHEIPECKLVATIGAPQRQEHEQLVSELKQALIIFHSPTDEVVGIDNARHLYQAAKHPKSFVSLDGADHLLTSRQDADFVGSVVSAWAERYVGRSEGRNLPEQPHARAIVGSAATGKYLQEMRLGSHAMLADEPLDWGGDNLGPSPYELLLGALGSCTAMTLQVYAERKKWPLERTTVFLAHEKRHVDDCQNCGEQGAKLDHIERELVLEGDLSTEQRERLLKIADMCPVHRSLHSEVRVTTRERSS